MTRQDSKHGMSQTALGDGAEPLYACSSYSPLLYRSIGTAWTAIHNNCLRYHLLAMRVAPALLGQIPRLLRDILLLVQICWWGQRNTDFVPDYLAREKREYRPSNTRFLDVATWRSSPATVV